MSGADALEALAVSDFDLVITDLRMPGMDGIETYSAYREAPPGTRTIPWILLTADVSASVAQRCKDRGFAAILPKPINLDQLIPEVDRVLASSEFATDNEPPIVTQRAVGSP